MKLNHVNNYHLQDPRLIDDTFTLDEVEDTLTAVTEVIKNVLRFVQNSFQ